MLTTQIVAAGNLAEPPTLAWTPQELAVLTLTVLVSNGRHENDQWVPAPPTRHRIKAFGDLAEHAAECLTTGDRILVIGSQRVDETWDRVTRKRHLTTWVYADELGPSLRDHPAPPQRPTANPRSRTDHTPGAGTPAVTLAAAA